MPPPATPQVSVIIPTLANSARAQQLQRAIASVRLSSAQALQLIVVVNGQRYDPALRDWLRDKAGVHFFQIEMGSLPLAVLEGRKRVQTPWFSTLDDDDEYLPGATDRRLAAAAAYGSADIVISNGYVHRAGVDHLAIPHLSRVAAAPLHTMFESAWLNSGNALYRAASFPVAFFEDHHPYVEWTWNAFRIARAGLAIATDASPGFRVHDSPQSLSKSPQYATAYLKLFERMLEANPDRSIARLIKVKLSVALHTESASTMDSGNLRTAWSAHLKSLMLPGGARYLPFTRHLMARTFGFRQ